LYFWTVQTNLLKFGPPPHAITKTYTWKEGSSWVRIVMMHRFITNGPGPWHFSDDWFVAQREAL
jgi:hypothetical protein